MLKSIRSLSPLPSRGVLEAVVRPLILGSLSAAMLAVAPPNNLSAQEGTLEEALFLLPDLTFEALPPLEGFTASFELRVRQPIDHQDPERGSFFQRLFLNYRGRENPTVIVTNGYARAANSPYELSRYVDANEVSVEHRYFGVSIPDSLDWSFLNLHQVAADLHEIRILLGELLSGPWAASGRSKGGMTTVAYRYFYPQDVSASVPYVAPLQTALEDKRIYSFLRSAGTPECREKQRVFQRWILAEKDQVLPRVKWFAEGRGWTFDYMGMEAALEYAVLEYPFSFWQYGRDCQEIPAQDSADEWGGIDEGLAHLENVVGLGLYSDEEIEQDGPHYYQAATQTGYYGFETEEFAELLEAVPDRPHAAFVPKRFNTTYDPTLLTLMTDWVESEGEDFVFLYGAVDTWTAAAVKPSADTNSLRFIMPGRHHGDALIRNLSDADRERIRSALEEWMGVRLDPELWVGHEIPSAPDPERGSG